MTDITERDRLLMDMYADIQTIKDNVGELKETIDEHTESITNIEKDIHAVKVSARLIKWIAPVVGALAGFASNTIKNLIKGGN